MFPEENNEFITNPYKGHVYYTLDVPTDAELSSDAASVCGVVYKRISWNVLEPQEGQYNWDLIDSYIDVTKRNGKMLGIGLGVAVTVNSSTSYTQGTPSWVFDAGAEYTEEMNGELKVPKWDDPIFKAKMSAFIQAFANRYNGSRDIAFVDMRNYGNWGEWHLGNLPNSTEISLEDKKVLVDMWSCVELPLVMFVADMDAAEYAVDTYGTGIRSDGVMNPWHHGYNKRLLCSEGVQVAIGEWYSPNYSGYRDGGIWEEFASYFPGIYENTIEAGKLSYFALNGFRDKDLFYAEQEKLIKHAGNRLGYWFKPTKISYPQNLLSGELSMTIKNDGVAPMYCGFEKTAYVKLALLNANNEVIDTLLLDGVNPCDWQPGQYSEVRQNFAFDNSGDAAKLALGIFTSENLEKPDVKLGIKGEIVDGWYVINTMPAQPSSNIASNCVYQASSEGTTDNYGINYSRYAFDNDYSTYWITDNNKEEYLIVDFGEEKTFDTITVSASGKKSTFSVLGYIGGQWQSIYSGGTLGRDSLIKLSKSCTATKLKFAISSPGYHMIDTSEMLANNAFNKNVFYEDVWKRYSSGKFKYISDLGHANDGCIYIYERQSGYDGISQDITDSIVDNLNNFSYGAWIMPLSDMNVSVKVRFKFSDGTTKTISASANCPENTWTEVSASYDIANLGRSDISQVGYIIETPGDETANMYVDDCSVYIN